MHALNLEIPQLLIPEMQVTKIKTPRKGYLFWGLTKISQSLFQLVLSRSHGANDMKEDSS